MAFPFFRKSRQVNSDPWGSRYRFAGNNCPRAPFSRYTDNEANVLRLVFAKPVTAASGTVVELF